jgi:hypothetical protein
MGGTLFGFNDVVLEKNQFNKTAGINTIQI